jgi:hypothetical protein
MTSKTKAAMLFSKNWDEKFIRLSKNLYTF